MDINNPFETFQTSAFRLEGLPQYLVEDEKVAFDTFQKTGEVPVFFDSDWESLVRTNRESGKTMKRLRLLSDELSDYETFETQIYTGPKAGEEIRANLRSLYANHYRYDFWLFDDHWMAEVMYEDDGTFVKFDMREATELELEQYHYWLEVFNESEPLKEFLLS